MHCVISICTVNKVFPAIIENLFDEFLKDTCMT